jgi:hypothetical protein
MNDDLDPARGISRGIVIAGLLWVGIFGGAALLIAKCLS